jgi:hypothetical protein
MAKLNVFEVKKKGKKGGTITEIHIFGSLVPEPTMKPVAEDAKVRRFKPKDGNNTDKDRPK